jgi:DNA-binding response OmpR family regulator
LKILIIEDNKTLLEQIVKRFEEEGYLCESSDTFTDASQKAILYEYDLIVIDINLPDGSGLNVIRLIKNAKQSTPIIVISARDSTQNKIEGLELGADDYLTKPFDVSELLARVKSVIRRSYFNGRSAITFGSITIETEEQKVRIHETWLELTKTEFNILMYFFSNPGRVLTREGMAEHIWGDHMDLADSYDFIYSHIKNLRKKIKTAGADDPIKVIYGVGYKLEI